MNFLFKYCLICFVLSAFASTSFAQEIGEKYEKEEKIKQEEFPKPALELIYPILNEGKKLDF